MLRYHGLIIAGLAYATIPAQAAAVLQEAPLSGVAAQTRTFAIIYTPGRGWKEGLPLERQNLAAHGRYMARLAKNGIIVAAGPLSLPSGGLVLIRAKDLQQAVSIMKEDPAVISELFVGTAQEWKVVFDPQKLFNR